MKTNVLKKFQMIKTPPFFFIALKNDKKILQLFSVQKLLSNSAFQQKTCVKITEVGKPEYSQQCFIIIFHYILSAIV